MHYTFKIDHDATRRGITLCQEIKPFSFHKMFLQVGNFSVSGHDLNMGHLHMTCRTYFVPW